MQRGPPPISTVNSIDYNIIDASIGVGLRFTAPKRGVSVPPGGQLWEAISMVTRTQVVLPALEELLQDACTAGRRCYPQETHCSRMGVLGADRRS